MKTVLVTGGAGFIGSHLCERLAKDGHKVISLDNYFTGSRENHVSGVEYREGHTKDIEKLVPETPDVIYHLGEYSRVEQSVLEPDVVHDLNTLGTRAVVEYWKNRETKLVYAGSSTKFGDGGATRESSPYARTKAENSELVRAEGERTGLPYAVTYFYNAYGPGERGGVYGTVIEQFRRMYLSGEPCALVAPGTQERNFTHVDDIVGGLQLVGENGRGDEFGIGNPHAYALKDVAALFGFGEDIIIFPPRPGNRMRATLDATKTRALGWAPKRELPDYIREFTAKNARGAHREPRVLVFSTTLFPSGRAEEGFLELARALPSVQFDVIAARFTREAAPSLPANVHLHPVGNGTSFDKYLLPFLAIARAASLAHGHRYLFAWAIMASYAAFAGVFSRVVTHLPMLITLADQDLDELPAPKRLALRLLISKADQVYGTHRAQEQGAMRAGRARLPRRALGEGDAFANALRFAYAQRIAGT